MSNNWWSELPVAKSQDWWSDLPEAPKVESAIAEQPVIKREMRAYEPGILERLSDLLPGDRARAMNEVAVQRIAERDNVTPESVYSSVGGSRPAYNPEGDSAISAAQDEGSKMLRGLSRIPGAIKRGGQMGAGGLARLVGESSVKNPISPELHERIRAKNPEIAAKIKWEDAPIMPGVAEWGGELYAKAKEEAQATTPKDQSFMEEAIVSAGQSVGQALPTLGAAALTRNPVAVGTALFGAQETSRAYGEARDKGLPRDEAVPYAIRNGLIEAGTERLSIGALFQKDPSFTKKIVNFLAREVPGENVAEISQEVNSMLSGVSPKTTVGEFISSLPRMIALTTTSTILGGGAQAGVMHGAQKVAEKIKGRNPAETKAGNPFDQFDATHAQDIDDQDLVDQINMIMSKASTPEAGAFATPLIIPEESKISPEEEIELSARLREQDAKIPASSAPSGLPGGGSIQSLGGSAYSSGDILSAKTGINQLLDKIEVEPSSFFGDMQPGGSKISADSGATAAKNLADLLERKPAIFQSLSSQDINTQKFVLKNMRRAAQDDQVFNSIVQLIPVDMMDNFVSGQIMSDVALHDMAVFKDLPSGDSDLSVPIAIDVAGRIAEAMAAAARFRAEPSLPDLQLVRGGKKPFPAKGAGDGDARPFGKTLAPPGTEQVPAIGSLQAGGYNPEFSQAYGTIDDRHNVTPYSNVGLGTEAADTVPVPPIISREAPTGDRRTDAATRKRVSEMTPEEMRASLLTSDLTGLGNRRAYEEAKKLPVQASIDADSLKWVNDNLSPDSGDKLLQAIGQALKDEGADAYHISGDEYMVQGTDEAQIDTIMERVQDRLKSAVIRVEKPDGTIIEKRGLEVTYGTGKDKSEADYSLKQRKVEREKAGLRAGRGEQPPGVSKIPPTGKQDTERGITGEVDQQTPEKDSAIPDAIAKMADSMAKMADAVDKVNSKVDAIGKESAPSLTKPESKEKNGDVSTKQEKVSASQIESGAVDRAWDGRDGAPLFSRGSVQAPVLDHDAVEAIASGIFKKLGLGRNLNLAVHQSESTLPPEILAAAREQGAEGEINAVYWRNKVHIVSSQMKSATDVETAIFHEALGHYGARALFGKEWGIKATQLYLAMGGEKGVRDFARKAGVNMDAYFKSAQKMPDNAEKALYLVDELLAHMQGKRATMSLPQRAVDAVKALIGEARQWLSRNGFMELSKLTDYDLAALLKRMRESATQAKDTAGKDKPMFMLVYHGSPHKFDKFDMSKIGTGEGAQAYGYGLYLAESPEVAKTYVKSPNGRPTLYDGDKFNPNDPSHVAADFLLRSKDRGEAIKVLNDIAENSPYAHDKKIYAEASKLLKNNKEAKGTLGTFYKVDIPDEAIARMLDWDKPLSEQSPEVQKSLQRGYNELGAVYPVDSATPKTGREVYNDFKALAGGLETQAPREASEYLKELGIPGIRYLDGDRRGKGGTSNYVIFDDSLPRILEINGVPTGAAPYADENQAGKTLYAMSAGGDAPLFSRSTTADDAVGRDDVAEKDIAHALNSLANGFTRDQLVEMYSEELPSLNTYKEMQEQRETERTTLLLDDDRLHNKMLSLPSEQMDSLADIAAEATLSGYDPANPKTPKSLAELKSLAESLRKRFKDTGKLTEPQMKLMIQAEKRIKEAPIKHAELQKRYDALSDEAKKVYVAARDKYRDKGQKVFDAVRDRINRMNLPDHVAKKAIEDMRVRFDKMLTGVYFPLARFGNNVVSGTQNGKPVVEYYESEREARRALDKMKADGITDAVMSLKKENTKIFAQKKVLDDIVKIISESASKAEDGLPSEALELLLDNVNQALIRAAPDMSYRRHWMHRKGVPGYSRDFIRAFADSMTRSANHISNIMYNDRIHKAIVDMEKEADTAAPELRHSLQDIVNHFKKREEELAKPVSRITSTIGQVGFISALGSISSGMVNLTQLGAVTMPYLMARYGAGAAIRLNADFATTINHITKALGKTGLTPRKFGESLDITTAMKEGVEKRLMTKLYNMDKINRTFALDLINAANHPSEQLKNSKSQRAIDTVMLVAAIPQHVSEVANRVTTALSAIKLEMAKSGNEEKALLAAIEAIDKTHFNYGAENRALVMHGNVARVVTMFKQYAQNMAYLWGRTAWLAVKDKDPETRRIARKQMAYMAASQSLIGGILGLPLGVEAAGVAGGMIGFRLRGSKGAYAMGITSAIAAGMLSGGWDDDEEDMEIEFRKAMAELATTHLGEDQGKAVAEIVSRGAFRMIFPGDIAGRVDQSELFIRKPDPQMEGQDAYYAWLTSALGYTVGYGAQVAQGAKLINDGEVYRGVEKIIPVKQVRDAMKAYRYETEGTLTLKGDNLLSESDPNYLKWHEITTQAVGFTPRRLAESYEGNTAVRRAEKGLTKQRQYIMDDLKKAYRKGDQAAIDGAYSRMGEFFTKNPSFYMDVSRSLGADARNRAAAQGGVVLSPKHGDLRKEGSFANN